MCGVALMTMLRFSMSRVRTRLGGARAREIMQGFGPKMRIEASYRSEKQRIFGYEKSVMALVQDFEKWRINAAKSSA